MKLGYCLVDSDDYVEQITRQEGPRVRSDATLAKEELSLSQPWEPGGWMALCLEHGPVRYRLVRMNSATPAATVN